MKKILLSALALAAGLTASADVTIDGVIYKTDFSTYTAKVAPQNPSLGNPNATGDIVIKESVVEGPYTFTVTAIAEDAFYRSTITSVTIPNTVTTIDREAFYGVATLTKVVIGSGVTNLSTSVFTGCTNLTEVVCNAVTPPDMYGNTFPADVKANCSLFVPQGSIEKYKNQMYNWYNFKEILPIGASSGEVSVVNYNGLVFDLDLANQTAQLRASYRVESTYDRSGYDAETIVIPQTVPANDKTYAVTSLQAEAFYLLTPKAFQFPEGLLSIGYESFYEVSSFNEIVFPNSFETLGAGCFYGAEGLKSITFGTGMKTIEGASQWADYNFELCTALTDVTCLAEVPPTLSATGFPAAIKAHATLTVPAGKADVYKAAPNWDGFKEYVELSDPNVGVDTIESTSQAPARWFTIQGVEISEPMEGQIVIEVRGNKATKHVYRK